MTPHDLRLQQMRLETIAAHEAQHNLDLQLSNKTLSPIEVKVLDKWSEGFVSTLSDLETVKQFGGTKRDNVKFIGHMLVSTKLHDLAFSLMSTILQDQFKEKTTDRHGRRFTQAAHAAALGKAVVQQMRLSTLSRAAKELRLEWQNELIKKQETWSPQMIRWIEGTIHADDMTKAIDDLVDSEYHLVVGHFLLRVLEKYELIEIEKSGMKGSSRYYVSLPSDLTDEISHRTAAMMANAFMRKPMICEPQSYLKDGKGGWLTDPLTGVGRDTWRRHGHDKKHNLKLPHRYAREVDRIAGTPYRIRKSILSVAQQVADLGLLWQKGDGGFFEFTQLSLSPALKYNEEEGADNKEYFENKTIREDEMKVNVRMRSLRQGILTATLIAEEYKGYSKIYFPVSCDWRGRVYFRTPGLSPQGDTFCKAVLEFSEGKKLGASGLNNLLKFAASVYTEDDVDKMEFKDQIIWAMENLEFFEAMVNDPMQYLDHWGKTDSPFEFLAACEEIVAAFKLNNPEDYVSHLPVRIDAVCSGIQHLSAASLDANVAPSVCLIGDTRPSKDFYNLIAGDANDILAGMTTESWQGMVGDPDSIKNEYDIEEIKKALTELGGFKRKDCKPIGMQYTYAVTRRTIGNRFLNNRDWRAKLLEYWSKRKDRKRMVARTGMFVADVFFHAVASCAGRCVDVMHWYQRVATICAEQNEGFQLTNAAGFTMTQKYLHLSEKHIASPMGSFRIKSRTDDVKMSKQVSGVAANATHCQDSCLVILTSELMPKNKSLTVIHDSMGTHACDVDDLLTAVRQSMYEMYKTNPLISIKQENVDNLTPNGGELASTELPSTGTFDIREMLSASYLFC